MSDFVDVTSTMDRIQDLWPERRSTRLDVDYEGDVT
jgi:hypothetical protein